MGVGATRREPWRLDTLPSLRRRLHQPAGGPLAETFFSYIQRNIPRDLNEQPSAIARARVPWYAIDLCDARFLHPSRGVLMNTVTLQALPQALPVHRNESTVSVHIRERDTVSLHECYG